MARRFLIAAVATLSFALLAPRTARACASGYGGGGGALDTIVLIVMAGTVADGALLISDGVIAAEGSTPSAGHGVGELLLGLPTAALGGLIVAAAAEDGGNSGRGSAIAIGAAIGAVGLFMVGHATWTFASQPETTPPHASLRLSNAREMQRAALVAAAAPPPPPPPLPALQLSLAPTVLAVQDRAGEKLAPGVGAVLRF